jgi:hypothetical protein
MTTLPQLQQTYHNEIALQIVRFSGNTGALYPNFADGSSRSSVSISNGIAELLGFPVRSEPRLSGQTAGSLFEKLTCNFLQDAFTAIHHLRPGSWEYLTTRTQISGFVQYRHLETLDALVTDNQTLSAALGHGYIVTPDIVVARHPATHEEVNASRKFLDNTGLASLTPFLARNQSACLPFLHASVSCKWTIRSDRSQNTRTEALNLIRNRQRQPAAYCVGNRRTPPDANCLTGSRHGRPGLRVPLRLG